jgi:hypothetical protein
MRFVDELDNSGVSILLEPADVEFVDGTRTAAPPAIRLSATRRVPLMIASRWS